MKMLFRKMRSIVSPSAKSHCGCGVKIVSQVQHLVFSRRSVPGVGVEAVGEDAYSTAQSDSVCPSGRFPVETHEKCDDHLLLPDPRQRPCAAPLSNPTRGA